MNKQGFSLIELIMVIAIIGLLSSLILPNFSPIQSKAKEASVKSVAHTLQVALESYYVSKGLYPAGEKSVTELVSVLQENGDLKKTPLNPFTGNMYTEADDSGKIVYSYDTETASYHLTVFGWQNEQEILTLQNI